MALGHEYLYWDLERELNAKAMQEAYNKEIKKAADSIYGTWTDLMINKLKTKTMTKEDLKTGMRVEYRNGDIRIVNKLVKPYCFAASDGNYVYMESYNNALINTNGNNTLDIVKVYDMPSNGNDIFNNDTYGKLLWERKDKKPFPKYMKHSYSPMIVLFTSETNGTVVYKGTKDKIGHYSEEWGISAFEDYNGHIPID